MLAENNQFSQNETSEEKTGLTDQIVMEETTVEKVVQHLAIGDPYPKFTPEPMLTRQYLIANYSITDTDTNYFFFPAELLMANDTISTYLKRFKYLRAGVKLRVLLVANQTVYGTVAVSFVPYTHSLTNWTSTIQQSQSNMHLLDVSMQESLELVLPYLSPKLYWTIGQEEPQWRVCIRALAREKLTIGADATISVRVYASFEEPEAAGLVSKGAVFQSDARPLTLARRIEAFQGLGRTVGTMTTVAANQAMRWVGNNPTVSVAGTTAAATSASSIFRTVQKLMTKSKEPQDEKATKAQLCLAPDLSQGGSSTLSVLGDPTVKEASCLPTSNHLTALNDIMGVPTMAPQVLMTDTTMHVMSCTPFIQGSYASYLKPMFKYWRGGTTIFVRFNTSPLASARISVTLFPTGVPASLTDIDGDLPNWILTVRGTTDFCLEVPYLQITPWSDCNEPDTYWPVLGFQFLELPPQPFDKPVTVTAMPFVSCSPDFCFAGTQSVVPQKTAVFQASVQDLSLQERITIGSTHPFQYQGGVCDIGQIINRYSSRDGVPSNTFPFPIRIEDWTTLYGLDNFDYISNLYAFYKGDTQVKTMFSKGLAGSLLVNSVGNSNQSPLGRDWRSGNSLTLTDQTVWPMLEYRYPYLNTVEFDSIWLPNGMYTNYISQPDNVDSYLISASDDFRLMYLLPVPDFFLTAKPTTVAEPQPVFQSYSVVPRFVGHRIASGYLSVSGPDATLSAVVYSNYPAGQSVVIELDVSLTRTGGNNDFLAICGLTNGVAAVPIPYSGSTVVTWPSNALAGFQFNWRDASGIGKDVYHKKCQVVIANLPAGDIRFFLSNDHAAPAGLSCSAAYTVRFKPWSEMVASSCVNTSSDTIGYSTLNTSSAVPVTIAGTINTNVTNAPSVSVVNTPSVSVSNVPHVEVQGSVTTEVSNTPHVIVDSVSSLISTSVQGISDPTYPVWTSLYKHRTLS